MATSKKTKQSSSTVPRSKKDRAGKERESKHELGQSDRHSGARRVADRQADPSLRPDHPLALHSRKVQTFQGRSVVTIDWKGKKVHAVAGRFAFKRKQPEKISQSIEEHLQAIALNSHKPERLGVGIVQTDSALDMQRAAEATIAISEKENDFHWMEPVTLIHATSIPNDERYPEQSGLKAIRFEQGMAHWTGNPNRVVLAILDTGIPLEAGQLSHPDLNDANRIFIGSDLVNNDNDPADDHGHGTHITGIAAAITDNKVGIAGLWQGPVLAIKILDANNNGSVETFRDGVHEAVQFAKQRQARLVVNFSGATQDTQVVREAIQFLGNTGGLLVASAGNNFGAEIDFPAAYSLQFSNVIAVGAVDSDFGRPEFGSSGPEMTVVSPGVGILSTLPNYHVTLNDPENKKSPKYDQMSGSSQAAPLVAALAALVWSKWPELGASQVRDKITQSADPIAGPTSDFGSGIINAERTLS